MVQLCQGLLGIHWRLCCYNNNCPSNIQQDAQATPSLFLYGDFNSDGLVHLDNPE
jgi:hypothetical protein